MISSGHTKVYLLATAALLALTLGLGAQRVSASSLYVCRDASGKQYYSNMVESGRCAPYATGRTGSFSVSGWPAYTRSSGWKVRYHSHIDHYAKRYNIDPNLIKAIIKAESDFDRYAISSRGAQGLMQLMPGTAKDLKVVDPFNPEQNIDGGVRYLRSLLKMFNGNVVLSLAAYNAGPTTVMKSRGVPRITETRNYVKRVLSHYKRYGRAG
jgi:soluble lytic murein transglycosylase-like protein